jgi:capsular polysaccharide biosynthesis protein
MLIRFYFIVKNTIRDLLVGIHHHKHPLQRAVMPFEASLAFRQMTKVARDKILVFSFLTSRACFVVDTVGAIHLLATANMFLAILAYHTKIKWAVHLLAILTPSRTQITPILESLKTFAACNILTHAALNDLIGFGKAT